MNYDVPIYLGSVLMFSSPYVPQSLCSPVPVSQSRCSRILYSPVSILPNPVLSRWGMPHVSQYLCSPVSLLPILQPLSSPAPILPRSGFPCIPSLYSPNKRLIKKRNYNSPMLLLIQYEKILTSDLLKTKLWTEYWQNIDVCDILQHRRGRHIGSPAM